jgi:flagellar biosynthetic protein FlhB
VGTVADSSKTEKATPKKRRDQRKKGNVFLSKEAVTVATLIGSFAVFLLWSDTMVEEISQFMTYCFTECAADPLSWQSAGLLLQAVRLVVKTVGPLLLASVVCAVVATFAQTKFLVSGEALKPKLEHISPIQGFKRLFSLKSVVEALKGILKIVILMVLIWLTLKTLFQECARYLYADLSAACAHLYDVATGMVIKVIIAFIVLSALDFMYQWWDFERQMKMSKQEVKEEYKQTEGDPQVKSKIKEVQRRRAQTRMMQQVPQADVVIRNPTHFAVALRYKPEQDNAPVVLAKGQDELALRIVKVAEENQVAVMENVPLARALYAKTELNREIPPELYGAVAEVLVYIFHLDEERKITK